MAGPQPPPGSSGALPATLLFSLALLAAMAPFGIDLYLPAFPGMMSDLETTATGVQLTLTSCLLGIAVGQLVFGSLSDRFGRRGPLLLGSALCVAASVVTATAPTIEVLVIARFVQGLSGAAGVVIGRAVIADTSTGSRAARHLSLMTAIGGAAPVVAPLIGGILTPLLEWRGILWVLFGIAAAMFVVSILFVPETRVRAAATPLKRPVGAVRAVLDPHYLAYTGMFVFSFGALMGYISASPFVYQEIMGLSATAFGVAFGFNSLLAISGGLLSARLVMRLGPHRLLGVGLGILSASSIAVLVLASSGYAWWTFVPLGTASIGVGLVFGNATALALGRVRQFAGTASAVLGALQFTVGAIVSPLVGIGGSESTLALGITMTITSLFATGLFMAIRRGRTA
ncbi:Bcr/CflA family drug resistance efflux transporter [Pseudoclavibacter endophyticus]|nr:Bcr/CflA family drug resistance efflux transporter [Pseudoclavibacter endophyticus]